MLWRKRQNAQDEANNSVAFLISHVTCLLRTAMCLINAAGYHFTSIRL
jgi:hypothetical protein